MTTPAADLFDRYENYRVRRWLVHEQRMSGMLLTWRTRPRRRALVITVAAATAVLFAAGLLCAFDLKWASVVGGVSALLFLPAWTMLRIASLGQDHAPGPMLDERENAQRNTARSIGLTITQTLALPPVMYSVWAGALAPGADASAPPTRAGS